MLIDNTFYIRLIPQSDVNVLMLHYLVNEINDVMLVVFPLFEVWECAEKVVSTCRISLVAESTGYVLREICVEFLLVIVFGVVSSCKCVGSYFRNISCHGVDGICLLDVMR